MHPDRLPTDLLEVALAGINLPGTAETNRAILQNVVTIRGWRPEMRLDDTLAAVEVPTLFAWGAKDQLAPADVARDLAKRMSDAQLAVIEDAGHIPHIDQPDAVATAINAIPAPARISVVRNRSSRIAREGSSSIPAPRPAKHERVGVAPSIGAAQPLVVAGRADHGRTR